MSILYHASTVIVDEPSHTKSGRSCDFGLGFYTHHNRGMALDWAYKKIARLKTDFGYINNYEFSPNSELSVHTFDTDDLLDLQWIDFILYNRGYRDYIGDKNHDFVSSLDADIIIGPIADQQLGAVFNSFLSGALGNPYDYDTKEYLFKNLINYDLLFNQTCFKTEYSLKSLEFVHPAQRINKKADG
jgi:hypothetical protein